ncbi:MAG TPA: Nif3-like dinuclear metal center hexameric protein [Bacillota bacterium]|nr:Nif3-like dinuclear metal center hexameric protein [Bacillota bacterium]
MEAKSVFQLMEKWAPSYLAFDWDNVGLQLGSFNKPIKRIMITLDVLEPVVDEAIKKNADLIIAHHPLFFKSVKHIDLESSRGRIIQKLLQHDITVYASHTNIDVANGGMNDLLCDQLGIQSRAYLEETYAENLYKLAVFVPMTHVEQLCDALGDSGAGFIGNYSHCTFQSQGQGTFKPGEGTNPYIGTKHALEKVEEMKVETVVPESKQKRVIDAMFKAHPYEEVAYDLYPIENKGKTYGIGRIGTLSTSMSLKEFAEHVKQQLELSHVRVTGDLSKQVKKVAVLGGSGEKYIHHAKRKGADVYITGDMTFHAAQEAWQMNLGVIDAGHYAEKIIKQEIKKYLQSHLPENIDIFVSTTNTDPFTFI